MKNDEIASAQEFELTDADYNEFKNKVKAANFKYDQQSEKVLKALKEADEFEGYLNDASDEFAQLEKKLSHDLDRDLDYFSKDIRRAISAEIIKRYYFQQGTIIEQLKDDNSLNEAIEILTTPTAYKPKLSVSSQPEPSDKNIKNFFLRNYKQYEHLFSMNESDFQYLTLRKQEEYEVL